MKINLKALAEYRNSFMQPAEVLIHAFHGIDPELLSLYFKVKPSISEQDLLTIAPFCKSMIMVEQYAPVFEALFRGMKKKMSKDAFQKFMKDNYAELVLMATIAGATQNIEVIGDISGLAIENAVDGKTKNSVMHFAIMHGHAALVTRLTIIAPSTLNHRNEEGFPPLLWAAKHGRKDMVDILLKNKAVNKTATVKVDGKICDYEALLSMPHLETVQNEVPKPQPHELYASLATHTKAALSSQDGCAEILVPVALNCMDFLRHSTHGKALYQLEQREKELMQEMRNSAGDKVKVSTLLPKIQEARANIKALNSEHKNFVLAEKAALEALHNSVRIFAELPPQLVDIFEFLEQELLARGSNDFLITLYCTAYCYHRDRGEERSDFLFKALAIDSADIEPGTKGSLYYNLGIHYAYSNLLRALEWFNKAEAFLPHDMDLITGKLVIHFQLDDIAAYRAEASKILDPDYKKTALLYSHQNNKQELLRMLEAEKAFWTKICLKKADSNTLVYEMRLMELAEQRDIEGLKSLCMSYIANKRPDAKSALTKALIHLTIIGRDESALDLLNIFYAKYPNIDHESYFIPELLYAEFIILENSGLAEEATAKLHRLNTYYDSLPEKNALLSRMVKQANYTRFVNLISDGKYTESQAYIEYMDLGDREVLAHLLKKLVQQISTAKGQVHRPEEQPDLHYAPELEAEGAAAKQAHKELVVAQGTADSTAAAIDTCYKLPSSVINFVTMVDTGQLDLDLLPSQLIEAYFRQKKFEQKLSSAEVVLSGRLEWTIGAEKYCYPANEATVVYKLESIAHYYTAIESSLLAALESQNPELKAAFSTALEHTRIARSHDQSGVKMYDNVIELKIMGRFGDMRLFTDTLLRDQNGNYLALFNRCGTHTDVEHMHVRNGELKILEAFSSGQASAETTRPHAAKSYVVDPQSYYYGFISNLDYSTLDPAIFLAGEGWGHGIDEVTA